MPVSQWCGAIVNFLPGAGRLLQGGRVLNPLPGLVGAAVYGKHAAYEPEWVSPVVLDHLIRERGLVLVANLHDHYDRCAARGGYVPVVTDGARSALDYDRAREVAVAAWTTNGPPAWRMA